MWGAKFSGPNRRARGELEASISQTSSYMDHFWLKSLTGFGSLDSERARHRGGWASEAKSKRMGRREQERGRGEEKIHLRRRSVITRVREKE